LASYSFYAAVHISRLKLNAILPTQGLRGILAVLQTCALFQENNDLGRIWEETKVKESFLLLQRLNLCVNSPTYLKVVYATFCGSIFRSEAWVAGIGKGKT